MPIPSYVESVLRCESSARPLFMPAIYEHKAWFAKDTPSRVSRDVELFYRAVMTEHEKTEPDALVIGMDVYNVEAEAVGCEVKFYEGKDTSIPGIPPEGHVIKSDMDLNKCKVPNPSVDGRMPLHIEVARRVVRALGDEVWIRGALSGPFSLAMSLAGSERIFTSAIERPRFVHQLLEFAAMIIKDFGQAYIDVGADVILFDSQASPDLLSPSMYEDFVLPVTMDIVSHFNKRGSSHVPLIIGGDTTDIRDMCVASGANNLLCDFKGNWSRWLDTCKEAKRAVRRNLNPQFVETGDADAIYKAASEIIAEAEGYPGFIMGTAVVPYGTPTENLLAIRRACMDAGKN